MEEPAAQIVTAPRWEPLTAEQLLEAASDGKRLDDLLDRFDFDIDIKNGNGLTALHLAIEAGDERAAQALLDHGADIEAENPLGCRALFIAVQQGQQHMVRILLERRALTSVFSHGRTPLHEAAIQGDVEIVRLLLSSDADIDAPSARGRQPLFNAVEHGHADVVRILLSKHADPNDFWLGGYMTDAYPSGEPPTCLHLAAANDDVDTMAALLDGGAKVDLRDVDSATPIFRAVIARSFEGVRLLLRHGASTRIWRSSDGKSVLDLAEGDDEMLEILNADRILKGPRIRGDGRQQGEGVLDIIKPPPAELNRDRRVACHGFHATITDFFTEGDHEQYIPKMSTVHELLYSHGPGAIRSRLGDREPDFTWYHLPSNNMIWVEGLIRRITAEKGDVSVETYDQIKTDLELSKAPTRTRSKASPGTRQQPTATGFGNMRPLCRSVPDHGVSAHEEQRRNFLAFVPFLHFETSEGHNDCARVLQRARMSTRHLGTWPPETRFVSKDGSVTPALTDEGVRSPALSLSMQSTEEGIPAQAVTSRLWTAVSRWRRKVALQRGKQEVSSSPDPTADVERQTSLASGPGNNHSMMSGKEGTASPVPERLAAQTREHPTACADDTGQPGTRPQSETHSGRQRDPSFTSRRDSQGMEKRQVDQPQDAPDQGPRPASETSRRQDDARSSLNQSRTQKEPARHKYDGRRHRVDPPTRNLNEYLIKGYLQAEGGRGLQPRRTLDQYAYSGIETTANRDNDQVVYRYTKDGVLGEAKIFMVDQLWMWVLGNDTVVTCCPLRWDPWLGKKSRQRAAQHPGPSKQADLFTTWLSGRVQPPQPKLAGPGWGRMLMKTRAAQPAARQHVAAVAEKSTWPEINPYDPLNVSQTIAEHLLKPGRGPVESVYELAGLITTSCLDVFDPHQVSDEYLFLDFFERSISTANDKVAGHLRQFKRAVSEFKKGAQSPEVMDISSETELMIEVDDILDELHTLKLVLTDQKAVVEDMNNMLRDLAGDQTGKMYIKTKTLDNHLIQIEQMEDAAKKADKSLHRLVDLKQKQASLAEAYYARESARDTARQGKTVVVFTVVTIIFLPVSFIAAIFAIETNGFPRLEDDKIPFNYALGYILTIGLAISIPLIIIAFNVDRIAKWLNEVRDSMEGKWHMVAWAAVVLGLHVATLAPIWVSDLAGGIKVAVSVVFVLLLVLAGIGYLLHRLITAARTAMSVTKSSYRSPSGHDGLSSCE